MSRASPLSALLAVCVAAAIGLLVFPAPTGLVDALLATQLGVAVVVVLAALRARHPLALSQLPTVLLLTTLFRLALNVSTTRLILADGDAGSVVAAFGDAVVRGNLVVGAVVFVVLTVVQYLVIARGAERVAQVGARFALDGLPGRQLAIDADVRAGLLDAEAARSHRARLARESSLFGAMDGAMKFVRGDAIAGLCIVGVNVVGGLAVGIGQNGMSPADAVALYTMLTVGDGLVAQIPAVLTATGAALLVTRVAAPDAPDPASAMFAEVAGDGRALAVAAGLLAVLAILPGLPGLPLFGVAALLAGAALLLWGRPPIGAAPRPLDSIPPVIPFGLALHPTAAAALGDRGAAEVVATARGRLRDELGVTLGAVAIEADAADLAPGGYRIEVGEAGVARGQLSPGAIFVCPPPDAEGPLALHPERSVPGRWVPAGPGLDPAAFLSAHLVAAWSRAGGLPGIQQVADGLAAVEQRQPALARAAVPQSVSLPRLARLMRRLLAEGVPVRDRPAILEALAHRPPECTDEAAQLRLVRRALAPVITARVAAGGAVEAIFPSASLEEALRGELGVGPQACEALLDDLQLLLARHPRGAIVAPPDLREALRGVVAVRFPGLPVITAEELVPGVPTVVVSLLG